MIKNKNTGVVLNDATNPTFSVNVSKSVLSTTLTAIASIDDTVVSVTSAAGVVAGQLIQLFNQTTNRFYTGHVVSIAVLDITIDTPMDSPFEIGDVIVFASDDLAVDGSVTTQIFKLRQDIPSLNIEADVTRLIVSMELASAPNYSEFGDIAALAKGIVLRRTDGTNNNLLNVKSNFEWALNGYDVDFLDNTGGGSPYGMKSRITFAGVDKRGAVIRIGQGQNIELLVQDNLTGLDSFKIALQGHTTET